MESCFLVINFLAGVLKRIPPEVTMQMEYFLPLINPCVVQEVIARWDECAA